MFKISNKNEIKSMFDEAGQVETFKYILLDYMRCKKLQNYVEILENNKISETDNIIYNVDDNNTEFIIVDDNTKKLYDTIKI